MADDFFSEIGRSLTRLTQTAVGKTGEIVESTKYNAQITNEQKEVEKLYQQIGELVYRGVKSGDIEVSDDLGDIIRSIDSHRSVIREARKSLAELQNKTVCPKCREIVANGTAFCPKCGYAFGEARALKDNGLKETVSYIEAEVQIDEYAADDTDTYPEE